MNKQEILNYLANHKNKFINDGVIILGLFGSFARQENTNLSDIDILIETLDTFRKNHIGFRAFIKLDDIKEQLKKDLKRDIDIVDKTCLKDKYILERTIYV
jgi:predicted nucleotidyltransferase